MQALGISPTRNRGEGGQNRHPNQGSYEQSPSQHHVPVASQAQPFPYVTTAKPYIGPEQFTMNDLTQGFGNLAIGPPSYPTPEQLIFQSTCPSGTAEQGVLKDSRGQLWGYVVNGQYILQPPTSAVHHSHAALNQSPVSPHYPTTPGSRSFGGPLQFVPSINTHVRQWDSAPPVLSLRDLPELDNRRASGGSWISQENRIPSPHTPYSTSFYGGQNIGVISNEHLSPYGYATSTPSPLSTGALALSKPFADSRFTPAALSAVLKKEPAIPEPSMAANPKQLPVEESLENPNAHTNVYIKGLAPETTDEMLESWAARFGEVHSTKSIIDTISKLCKGYGFARFYTIGEAQYCILAFRHGGYEASFAKESFNALLKQNSDGCSTNLYLSGLPLNLTSETLHQLFEGHQLASARVLMDDDTGKSRGVGFARFLSRNTCEEVIKKYHGQPLGEAGGILQVRYADTPEQKALKHDAATRRTIRSSPYPLVVDGRSAPLQKTLESENGLLTQHRTAPVGLTPRNLASIPNSNSVDRLHSIQAISFDRNQQFVEQSPTMRKVAVGGKVQSNNSESAIPETAGTHPIDSSSQSTYTEAKSSAATAASSETR